MLPPWNKIEWGLPIAHRPIDFMVDGRQIRGHYNGTGFYGRDLREYWYTEQVTEWRYLDEVRG